jgi:hypothetical protein
MDEQRTDRAGSKLLTGSLALLVLGLTAPALFGILYAAVGGAMGGLGLILLMVAIPTPLMLVAWRFLPKVNRDQEN